MNSGQTIELITTKTNHDFHSVSFSNTDLELRTTPNLDQSTWSGQERPISLELTVGDGHDKRTLEIANLPPADLTRIYHKIFEARGEVHSIEQAVQHAIDNSGKIQGNLGTNTEAIVRRYKQRFTPNRNGTNKINHFVFNAKTGRPNQVEALTVDKLTSPKNITVIDLLVNTPSEEFNSDTARKLVREQCPDAMHEKSSHLYGDHHYINFDGKLFEINGDYEVETIKLLVSFSKNVLVVIHDGDIDVNSLYDELSIEGLDDDIRGAGLIGLQIIKNIVDKLENVVNEIDSKTRLLNDEIADSPKVRYKDKEGEITTLIETLEYMSDKLNQMSKELDPNDPFIATLKQNENTPWIRKASLRKRKTSTSPFGKQSIEVAQAKIITLANKIDKLKDTIDRALKSIQNTSEELHRRERDKITIISERIAILIGLTAPPTATATILSALKTDLNTIKLSLGASFVVSIALVAYGKIKRWL